MLPIYTFCNFPFSLFFFFFFWLCIAMFMFMFTFVIKTKQNKTITKSYNGHKHLIMLINFYHHNTNLICSYRSLFGNWITGYKSFQMHATKNVYMPKWWHWFHIAYTVSRSYSRSVVFSPSLFGDCVRYLSICNV